MQGKRGQGYDERKYGYDDSRIRYAAIPIMQDALVQDGLAFLGKTGCLEIVVVLLRTTDDGDQTEIVQVNEIVNVVLVRSDDTSLTDALQESGLATA